MAEKGNGKRVLVVDDEETVGIGLTEMLTDAGYRASYVTSGKEAAEEVKKTTCSLIFIDMVMPGMNGLETYRLIKGLSPKTNVVLFTGYYKDAYREIFQGIKEGMIDEFIRKPFFPEEILETARKYA
jgi:CheY-like chemotaxis protein